jgi:hypothetical protein
MSIRTTRGLETSLYDAVKVLVVTELKLALSMDLVLQGVERLRVADEVWLAVLATRRGRDRDRRAHRLCRLLGFGLLAVHPARGRVEILAEPAPYRPRSNLRQRRRLLKEHAARRGDPTRGGSARQPIMTAYRQQALACAAALQVGPLRPRDLKPMAPNAGRILLRNVYGWFERVEPGLLPAGRRRGSGTAPLDRVRRRLGHPDRGSIPRGHGRLQQSADRAGSSVAWTTTPP